MHWKVVPPCPHGSGTAFLKTSDVTNTLELALQASGCDQVNVVHKPRLLSDNGASYISGNLADWLDDKGMDHVRGAPYHPQTQGNIARMPHSISNQMSKTLSWFKLRLVPFYMTTDKTKPSLIAQIIDVHI